MPVGAWTSPERPAAYAPHASSWNANAVIPRAASHARAGANGSAWGFGAWRASRSSRRRSAELTRESVVQGRVRPSDDADKRIIRVPTGVRRAWRQHSLDAPEGIVVAVNVPTPPKRERATTILWRHRADSIEVAEGTWRNGTWQDFDPVSISHGRRAPDA